jgi:Sec-independent protein translocase protein TatA
MWLTIIFQLLVNLPSVIKAVIEIIKLLRELRDEKEKVEYQARLVNILRRANKAKTVSDSDKSELEQLKDELKAKVVVK